MMRAPAAAISVGTGHSDAEMTNHPNENLLAAVKKGSYQSFRGC